MRWMKCWTRSVRQDSLVRVLLLFVLLAAATALAQDTIHTQSNLVIVPALVKNAKGEAAYGRIFLYRPMREALPWTRRGRRELPLPWQPAPTGKKAWAGRTVRDRGRRSERWHCWCSRRRTGPWCAGKSV